MPFCPRCRHEYREGLKLCPNPECGGVKLVDELPSSSQEEAVFVRSWSHRPTAEMSLRIWKKRIKYALFGATFLFILWLIWTVVEDLSEYGTLVDRKGKSCREGQIAWAGPEKKIEDVIPQNPELRKALWYLGLRKEFPDHLDELTFPRVKTGDEYSEHFHIKPKTKVKILVKAVYETAMEDGNIEYQVEVLEGAHKGKTGWMFYMDIVCPIW